MTNYLTPIVAVLLGIALVDERLTWNLIIGAAMILVGLWIAEHDPNERQALSDTLMFSKDQGLDAVSFPLGAPSKTPNVATRYSDEPLSVTLWRRTAATLAHDRGL